MAIAVFNPHSLLRVRLPGSQPSLLSISLIKTLKLPLDGTKFFTDPASYNTGFGNVRGIYVHGSFKVNDIAVEPNIDADGKLSYIFRRVPV